MFNDKKVNVQVTIAKSMAYFTSDSEFAGKIDRGYKVSSLILYEHIVLSYNQKLFDLNQKKFYGFQQNWKLKKPFCHMNVHKKSRSELPQSFSALAYKKLLSSSPLIQSDRLRLQPVLTSGDEINFHSHGYYGSLPSVGKAAKLLLPFLRRGGARLLGPAASPSAVYWAAACSYFYSSFFISSAISRARSSSLYSAMMWLKLKLYLFQLLLGRCALCKFTVQACEPIE